MSKMLIAYDTPSKIENLSSLCFEVYGNRLAPYILSVKEFKQKEKLKIISEINNGIEIYPNRMEIKNDA